MVRFFACAVIILINYVLQTTVWAQFSILGVVPDTALVLIISYGILRGDIEGALFGLSAGFLQDIFSGIVIGLYALLGFLVGYFSGSPLRSFFKNNYFLPLLLVVCVSFLHQFLIYVATMLFMGQLDFVHYFATVILPKTIYTASVAVPIYVAFYYLNLKIEAYEFGKRNLFEEPDKEDF